MSDKQEQGVIDERAEFEKWADSTIYFGDEDDGYMAALAWKAWQARAALRASGDNETAEIKRLREDCAEAYQVVGALAGKRFNDADVEKALDNLVAAANGTPRPHDDLLPFSHLPKANDTTRELAEALRDLIDRYVQAIGNEGIECYKARAVLARYDEVTP